MANEDQNPKSQFNARADQAALALRGNLINQGRQMPDRASVAVGPDGQPPAPPPPEGSYVRMAMERQRQLQPPQQPPQPRAEDQDPGQTPPVDQPETATPELSDKAERRIAELVSQLRAKDRELQDAVATSQRQGETLQQLEHRLNGLQQQHDQLIQQNLDHLDPETRAAVLSSSRVQETAEQVEQRVLRAISPLLQQLQEGSIRNELERISKRYPGFSVEVHGPLIERFRQRNPACTIEQAFRAVAEPEELQTSPRQSAAVVPPIVPPGNGRATQRYVPAEQPKSNPEAELVEEAQRLKDLAQKGQAKAIDWHEHLKRRLS